MMDRFDFDLLCAHPLSFLVWLVAFVGFIYTASTTPGPLLAYCLALKPLHVVLSLLRQDTTPFVPDSPLWLPVNALAAHSPLLSLGMLLWAAGR